MMSWRRPVDWESRQNRSMDFWGQLPWSTRLLLGMIGVLAVVFVLMLFVRAGLLAVDSAIVSYLLRDRRTAQVTPLAVDNASAEATIAPNLPSLTASANVEIRSGPSIDFPSIGILEKGQSAEVVGVSPDTQWWAIKLPYVDSGRAWVPAGQVAVRNTELVTVVNVEVPTRELATVLAVANINVRSGPGLDYERIGLLEEGQTAEVLGMDEGGYWFFIRLFTGSDIQGWIAKDYVIAKNTAGVPVVGSTPGAPMLVAKVMINVRAGPGKEYAVIGSLEKGQGAEVMGISADGEWFAIKFAVGEGGLGWVAASFVKVKNVENVPVLKN